MYYFLYNKITNRGKEQDKNIEYKYIFFGTTLNNKIIENGKFTRIYYSSPLCSLNGIYIEVDIDEIEKKEYNIRNNKLLINLEANKEIIRKLKIIEENILNVINIENKNKTRNIYNEIKKGYIKLNYKPKNKIMLKISGMWETNSAYGLTHKFFNITDEINHSNNPFID